MLWFRVVDLFNYRRTILTSNGGREAEIKLKIITSNGHATKMLRKMQMVNYNNKHKIKYVKAALDQYYSM